MDDCRHTPDVTKLAAECPLPFCATRDDIAPLFTAEGYINGDVKEFCLKDQRGKWVILFFYASDFTFV